MGTGVHYIKLYISHNTHIKSQAKNADQYKVEKLLSLFYNGHLSQQNKLCQIYTTVLDSGAYLNVIDFWIIRRPLVNLRRQQRGVGSFNHAFADPILFFRMIFYNVDHYSA